VIVIRLTTLAGKPMTQIQFPTPIAMSTPKEYIAYYKRVKGLA
jgi:hypothetical protein